MAVVVPRGRARVPGVAADQPQWTYLKGHRWMADVFSKQHLKENSRMTAFIAKIKLTLK